MRVHEIGRFHGYRGPERVRVHRIRLFYGRQGSDGCASIESGFFMDVEVRIEYSADPSARRVGIQVFQRHPGVAKGASDRS